MSALASVAVATAAIYPLKQIAPVVSLSVVYLPAVLLVSAYWGLGLGVVTALLSGLAFNFFHFPPVGYFTIADSRNVVALVAFTIVAVVVSTIAELARSRAEEAESREAEADLAAALARELLAGSETGSALATAARLISDALGMSWAALTLGPAADDDRALALALHSADGDQIATLLVPREIPHELRERIGTQVVPVLEALVALAIRRDAMQAEAVETAALRRSDEIKTALLRAVSHDLRTPLTAILAAGHALGSESSTAQERAELSAAVVEEGTRMAALVDKLLDLSKLQAGTAEPRREWVSIEELVLAAGEGLNAGRGNVRLDIERDLPEVRADAAQLERVFANLLENAHRYSGGRPVVVHAHRRDRAVVIEVVDHGPGIEPSERERIFEPFFRGSRAGASRSGSGLGLAIAKGFVEANGGTISVRSAPGEGSTFIVWLPVQRERLPAVRT